MIRLVDTFPAEGKGGAYLSSQKAEQQHRKAEAIPRGGGLHIFGKVIMAKNPGCTGPDRGVRQKMISEGDYDAPSPLFG